MLPALVSPFKKDRGDSYDIDVLVIPVTSPLPLTTIDGMLVELPNVPGFVLTVASVITPVSLRVASPESVVNVGTLDEFPISSCPPIGAEVTSSPPVELP